MRDTNVGIGMAPCRKGCRCLECQLETKDAEIERLQGEAVDDAVENANLKAENAKLKAFVDAAKRMYECRADDDNYFDCYDEFGAALAALEEK